MNAGLVPEAAVQGNPSAGGPAPPLSRTSAATSWFEERRMRSTERSAPLRHRVEPHLSPRGWSARSAGRRVQRRCWSRGARTPHPRSSAERGPPPGGEGMQEPKHQHSKHIQAPPTAGLAWPAPSPRRVEPHLAPLGRGRPEGPGEGCDAPAPSPAPATHSVSPRESGGPSCDAFTIARWPYYPPRHSRESGISSLQLRHKNGFSPARE